MSSSTSTSISNVAVRSIPAIIGSLERFISKKFLVWAVSSVALFTGFITADDWLAISLIYVGAQSFLDWRDRRPAPSKTTSTNVNTNVNTTTSNHGEETIELIEVEVKEEIQDAKRPDLNHSPTPESSGTGRGD